MSDGPTPITPENIMQLGFGYWGSKALLSAVELGVFTILAEGGLNAASLATRVGIHERAARDFFDALVALRMLRRNDDVYLNTPETEAFLDSRKDSYVGGLLAMSNERLYGFWGNLTEALRTGRPQNEIKNGTNLFESLYADQHRLSVFLKAMTGVSLGSAHAIARKFPWSQYSTFVDIGTAQGALPVTVARSHQHLRGAGFDLPVVKPLFDAYVQEHQLSNRVSFLPGDFFRDSLPDADVLVMGHILHDWNLDEKRMLLDKAYTALPNGGALLIYEALIDDARTENAFGLLMSLNMLIETKGGFDYTGADCAGWMRDAGFSEVRVQHLVGPDSMVIGIK